MVNMGDLTLDRLKILANSANTASVLGIVDASTIYNYAGYHPTTKRVTKNGIAMQLVTLAGDAGESRVDLSGSGFGPTGVRFVLEHAYALT